MSKLTPRAAYEVSRLVAGLDLNCDAEALPETFKRFATMYQELPEDAREPAWQGFLAAREDRDEVIKMVADADPEGPPPEGDDSQERCATRADVRRIMADTKWPWPGWLATSVLNALAADPGTGKTVMAADLARRLWIGESWPDGQPNPFPKATRTLWVPGDRHYAQLSELLTNFGIPDEGMLLNARSGDPMSGLDLDDEAEREALERRIEAERPGLLIIDTVGMTTDRNLCRPEDARAYFGPLMDMAQRTGIPFLLLTHLSKDGNALGRRISGACRLVWKMTKPDPDGQQDRRKVWVDKTYTIQPPPLGMTIATAGCSFDFNPPTTPEPDKGGRPAGKVNEAIDFLTKKLTEGNAKQVELIGAWEALGEAKGTLFNAFKAMQKDGRLVIDDSAKPKVCHLVRNPEEGQEPSF